jgi:hypothetical protein
VQQQQAIHKYAAAVRRIPDMHLQQYLHYSMERYVLKSSDLTERCTKLDPISKTLKAHTAVWKFLDILNEEEKKSCFPLIEAMRATYGDWTTTCEQNYKKLSGAQVPSTTGDADMVGT